MAVYSNWKFSVYSDLELDAAFYMTFGITVILTQTNLLITNTE